MYTLPSKLSDSSKDFINNALSKACTRDDLDTLVLGMIIFKLLDSPVAETKSIDVFYRSHIRPSVNQYIGGLMDCFPLNITMLEHQIEARYVSTFINLNGKPKRKVFDSENPSLWFMDITNFLSTHQIKTLSTKEANYKYNGYVGVINDLWGE